MIECIYRCFVRLLEDSPAERLVLERRAIGEGRRSRRREVRTETVRETGLRSKLTYYS